MELLFIEEILIFCRGLKERESAVFDSVQFNNPFYLATFAAKVFFRKMIIFRGFFVEIEFCRKVLWSEQDLLALTIWGCNYFVCRILPKRWLLSENHHLFQGLFLLWSPVPTQLTFRSNHWHRTTKDPWTLSGIRSQLVFCEKTQNLSWFLIILAG